jgi:hypothetical protein
MGNPAVFYARDGGIIALLLDLHQEARVSGAINIPHD